MNSSLGSDIVLRMSWGYLYHRLFVMGQNQTPTKIEGHRSLTGRVLLRLITDDLNGQQPNPVGLSVGLSIRMRKSNFCIRLCWPHAKICIFADLLVHADHLSACKNQIWSFAKTLFLVVWVTRLHNE